MPIYIVWAPQAQEGQKVLINSDDDDALGQPQVTGPQVKYR